MSELFPTETLPAAFGEFMLLERIGTGGMAEIYLARYSDPAQAANPPFVIKRLLPELANNRTLVDLLIAEARVTSLLHHPNIVRIDGHGHVDGRYYISMEYIDGPDFLALLGACTHGNIRMPTELALHVLAEVARGLAHAHVATDQDGNALNIIHRDVSPSNVLIGSRGDIKIMDFGVARADLGMSAPERERGGLRGKIGYMSPEQVMSRPIDRRADVFALGIVLFEALTLKRLFVGTNDVQTLMNIREADVDSRLARHAYIPRPLRDLLRKALAKNPDERFQTASDFREAILDYLFQQRKRVEPEHLASFVSQLMSSQVHIQRSAADHSPRELESDAMPMPPPVVIDPLASLRQADFSRATFHFRNRDGSLFGPVNYPQLQSLITEFAVSPGDFVSVNNSDWLRIRDIPALVAAHPVLLDDEPIRPNVDGPIHALRLPSVFFTIAREHMTGKLKLTSHDAVKCLFFDAGRPVAAFSTLKTDLFGAWLVERGRITQAQLDQALAVTRVPARPLGQTLVEARHLTAEELDLALIEHLKTRMNEAIGWRDGWYEFFEGVFPPRRVDNHDLDLTAMVVDVFSRQLPQAELENLFDDFTDRKILPTPTTFARHVSTFLGPERLSIAQQLLDHGGRLRDIPGTEADRYLVALLLHQADGLSFARASAQRHA